MTDESCIHVSRKRTNFAFLLTVIFFSAYIANCLYFSFFIPNCSIFISLLIWISNSNKWNSLSNLNYEYIEIINTLMLFLNIITYAKYVKVTWWNFECAKRRERFLETKSNHIIVKFGQELIMLDLCIFMYYRKGVTSDDPGISQRKSSDFWPRLTCGYRWNEQCTKVLI